MLTKDITATKIEENQIIKIDADTWQIHHYKTQDRERFLVQELVKHVSFSRLTGNNAQFTKVVLVKLGIFIPGNEPGMPRREPGKNTCRMSAIPGHDWA